MPKSQNKKAKPVNLLPKEDFDRTTLGKVLKWSLTTFRFIVIAVELVVIAGFLSRFWLDVQISDLDDEIVQKSVLIDAQEKTENEFRKYQLQLSVLAAISDESNGTLQVLRDVSSQIPQDTTMTAFTRDAAEITIQGETRSAGSINAFVSGLRQNIDTFESVALTRIEKDTDSLVNIFTINAVIDFEALGN